MSFDSKISQVHSQMHQQEGDSFKHLSVMLEETVDMLNVREGGVYVDGTLGGGGHSAEILRRLSGTETSLPMGNQRPCTISKNLLKG